VGHSEVDGNGLDELEQLVLGQSFLIGLVEQLCRSFPDAGLGLAEEAVEEAVRKLVVRTRKPPPVTDVRGYLARVAFNTLQRAAPKLVNYERPMENAPEIDTASAESDALRYAAIQAVKKEIGTWANANMREVMLVYIDAITIGEPIEAEEVAELVSPILGEEISPGSVRVWKQRGMKRLREFVEQSDWGQGRMTNKETRK
jgi:DNA-directed RNA polymerase specialized sigma24 family protein